MVELKTIYHRKILERDGRAIMEHDWDNLIILDACRYDLFEHESSIQGELTPVISSGSSTSEFLVENFEGGNFFDTVYVTANPQFEHHEMGQYFHDDYPLWEDEWDDDFGTVLPEDVAKRSNKVQRENPHKRLIIHFLQPHYPFIGEHGRKIEHGSVTGSGIIAEGREQASIWERLEQGQVDESRVWSAYRENLRLTLPHVQFLLDELVGKTVVTSDHGNAFGEWGIYGHPSRLFLDSLVVVPWLVVEDDTRKTIEDGQEKGSKRTSSSEYDVQERLRHLGYK